MNAQPSYVARNFGARVRDERKLRGLRQDDFADRLAAVGHPMHQTTISKIESGTRPTTIEELVAIAAVLKVRPASLVDGVGR